ncbi:MAG: class I SAM-dependent DNA methyltransferase [Oscillibacter sp.]|nr:class I SAM-dependent DNA methyltransferase [Oscillibacter sp.]
MNDMEQRAAAREFVANWTGRGDEKQETQTFWMELLQTVYGVENPARYIAFEVPVKLSHTSFIDAYIEETRVLIEQKGADIDLRKGQKQSDGVMLTPFQQARRYAGHLPHSQYPRWIVVCNFRTFHIHDMERPNEPPEVLKLADLETEYWCLNFLTNTKAENIQQEEELSKQAGKIVEALRDALLKQYRNPESPETLKSLNALCVRLVFCLYAEDAGIFDRKRMFHDYLQAHQAEDRDALINLFRVLDRKPEERDPYLSDDLLAFPYVNGGLFADEAIEIPRLGDEVIDIILKRASEHFNWSRISPPIFGAVFESTLNPETRRSGGMHYTSIENIHKVIDPLFLDELKAELEQCKSRPTAGGARRKSLQNFQKKLASLKFLDPACGSGNFLTETYLSLRRMENEIIAILNDDQIVMDLGKEGNPIQISIGQFYGIEINDFAVAVARTALWIAESQMMNETIGIVHRDLHFLPLKTAANIVEGNALRMDWESVVPKYELNYIMGNPPFVGYSLQNKEQKADILSIYTDETGKPYKAAGKIDYVSGWYFKAAQYVQGTAIRAAFVSTNSITQGEQVASVWKPLYERFGIHIDFAHRTFRWDSEASLKAHVHCVIVGFSIYPNDKPKVIYASGRPETAQNINGYLLDAPDIFIESRNKPLCGVPVMTTGNRPADGGHLIIEADEYDDFIAQEPKAIPYIKKLIGAAEFINNKQRWCLWLVGANPAELRKMPKIMERVELCRQDRLHAPDEGRRKLADTPTLFRETKNPDTFIVIPATSSQRRRYVPIGFLNGDTIATNAVIIIPNATLYHFGILTSNVHMGWMRVVCGRLKSDYRYSKDIVYNNFPWPNPTGAQRATIEQTAQAILDARALYPDASLADLYDETVMPAELRKAHQNNDRAVMWAYGFDKDHPAWNNESQCVAELMKLYQRLARA